MFFSGCHLNLRHLIFRKCNYQKKKKKTLCILLLPQCSYRAFKLLQQHQNDVRFQDGFAPLSLLECYCQEEIFFTARWMPVNSLKCCNCYWFIELKNMSIIADRFAFLILSLSFYLLLNISRHFLHGLKQRRDETRTTSTFLLWVKFWQW